MIDIYNLSSTIKVKRNEQIFEVLKVFLLL
jgi:hypothetical protein